MSDYKVVPVEPTEEMLEVGHYAMVDGCSPRGVYAYMLAAAPQTSEQKPTPDVSALAEALEEALHYVIISPDPVRSDFIREIEAALATYRKRGE